MKEFVYKILDLLTGKKGLRKTVNGFSIKLPARFINYFPEDYEKENFAFLRERVRSGENVLDIGAHIGLFSIAAAQLTGKAGKVFAFEPATDTQKLLKQTIAINQLSNLVEFHHEAIGATSGKTTFYVSPLKGDNSNSLVAYKKDRKMVAIEVDMLSIDDFVHQKNLSSLSLIKLDVEGAELDAIKGAQNTLQQLKPVCIVAIHPEPIAARGNSLEEIYDLINSMNYKIFYRNEIIPKSFFCNNRELMDLHIVPA